jgi:hypothetical protein
MTVRHSAALEMRPSPFPDDVCRGSLFATIERWLRQAANMVKGWENIVLWLKYLEAARCIEAMFGNPIVFVRLSGFDLTQTWSHSIFGTISVV